MSGLEYPKIDTLYNRLKNGKVDIASLRRPEFELINRWQITEKLNGRNIRVMLTREGEVTFAGRKDEKHLYDQIDDVMLDYLKSIFIPRRMKYIFRKIDKDGSLTKPEVCLYLEGIGSKMASGSGIYCKGIEVSVRLIDAYIKPFWIERLLLEEFAKKLGVKCVPVIGYIDEIPHSRQCLEDILSSSIVATEAGNFNTRPEGIVARTSPILFSRTKTELSEVGERIMWKLKFKDF